VKLFPIECLNDGDSRWLWGACKLHALGVTRLLGARTEGDDYRRFIPLMDATPAWKPVMSLLASSTLPNPCRKLLALRLVQVPVPVMALGVSANRFVVVECVQQFTFGPLGCRFLLANRTVHGKSDEHFSHRNLPEE
jgi:hypothetical protein